MYEKVKKKVLFWGGGNYAREWWSKYQKDILKYYEIIGIVDSNFEKCESICGYEVNSPEIIWNSEFDFICILNRYYIDEIKNIIIKTYNIPQNKIILNDFLLAKKVGQMLADKSINDIYENRKEKKIALDYILPDNQDLKKQVDMWIDYAVLKEKYEDYLNLCIQKNNRVNLKREKNKTIWMLWLQGEENAPDIVKICINSVRKMMKDYQVIVLSEKNLYDYITIPVHIMEKYKKGMITATHYSDYIRCELLVKYGGIWIDATLLLTQRIPEALLKSNLFFLTHQGYSTGNVRTVTSGFIITESNNEILILCRDMLKKYWEENDELINYFLIHMFIRMIFEKKPKVWKEMKHFVINFLAMLDLLNEPYNEEIYNFVKESAFLHKLDYKRELSKDKNSTYSHILKEYL